MRSSYIAFETCFFFLVMISAFVGAVILRMALRGARYRALPVMQFRSGTVKRHWKLWTGLVLVLLLLGVGGIWVATREPEAVRAYERIKLGTTLQEVEDAIGMPSAIYMAPSSGVPVWRVIRNTGLPSSYCLGNLFSPKPDDLIQVRGYWVWDNYAIVVALDKGDRAVSYCLLENNRQPIGFFDRLKNLLGL